ncbi:hypothetical protein BH10ACI1_BH10ACI1_15140 [soil metagenome]
MKKNTLTFIFMLLAVMVLMGNVQAKSSIFTSASQLELNKIQSNLFKGEPQNRYTLTITNRSKWDITEVYVETSENQRNWGKEWLDGRVLTKDTYIDLTNLKPGEYDVRFVDEGDDECILNNIAITKNTSWAITTQWLEKCEGYR